MFCRKHESADEILLLEPLRAVENLEGPETEFEVFRMRTNIHSKKQKHTKIDSWRLLLLEFEVLKGIRADSSKTCRDRDQVLTAQQSGQVIRICQNI